MFIRHKKTQDEALNIFTFPYAGGGLNCYRELLDPIERKGISVINLELPGRQRLFKVQPFTSMHKLVDTLAHQIEPLLDQPYVLYGHSMGGWIAFDLACQLQARHRRLPEALIVSASRSPVCAHPEWVNLNNLDNIDVLHDWMIELGFPALNESLINLVKPALLADFKMMMMRTHSCGKRIPIPFHVIYSNEDPVAAHEHVFSWQDLTLMDCRYYPLNGGHFFIYERPSDARNVLSDILENITSYIPTSHSGSAYGASILQGAII